MLINIQFEIVSNQTLLQGENARGIMCDALFSWLISESDRDLNCQFKPILNLLKCSKSPYRYIVCV